MRTIRVTVAATRGSAPREAGASMSVDATHSRGSIGGGHLEWLAIRMARDMLCNEQPAACCQRFVLGASLGQCCGGVVDLWFEQEIPSPAPAARWRLSRVGAFSPIHFTHAGDAPQWLAPSLAAWQPPLRVQLLTHLGKQYLLESLHDDRTPLWLYGGGHIAQAMQPMLASLPFATTWIDNRDDVLPAMNTPNITPLPSDDPAAEALLAPDGAFHLVMTHDHALDFAIVHALLAQARPGFVGLIGSKSKRARFLNRLEARNISAQQRARLCSPIGVEGIKDKSPMAIAVSCCAQLLQLREQKMLMQSNTSAYGKNVLATA
ncbi:xanthine dehydrogenase accessory protein XdhC [Craterilacuibacter sinensis]|uniref:Xanthine dehydrogenase accessory protein XdhC n=1 Tax=Craterilacuibacter sinensis TaxID=2686017 RepID=A0A845BX42_9NEIS|nr:xanthine dehydrogenase accessory protein XdhC [Craterilacuibacter sinensis]MXR37073.1 xanthine dehydrogenase accessory protein XdhC [Craterilacuibacter sinensis]